MLSVFSNSPPVAPAMLNVGLLKMSWVLSIYHKLWIFEGPTLTRLTDLGSKGSSSVVGRSRPSKHILLLFKRSRCISKSISRWHALFFWHCSWIAAQSFRHCEAASSKPASTETAKTGPGVRLAKTDWIAFIVLLIYPLTRTLYQNSDSQARFQFRELTLQQFRRRVLYLNHPVACLLERRLWFEGALTRPYRNEHLGFLHWDLLGYYVD